MRVRVSTRRNGGRTLRWNEKPAAFEGTLLSTRQGAEDRKVVVLSVGDLEPHGPTLYEPRLVAVLGNELRFVGLEKHDQAWVLQEWNCEILGR